MHDLTTERCFLLTRNYRDHQNHFEIDLFAKSDSGIPIQITITDFRPLFFIPHTLSVDHTKIAMERRPLPLRAFDEQPVDCLYFRTAGDLLQCAKDLRSRSLPVFESDIHPVDRFLMERKVFGGFEASGTAHHTDTCIIMQNPHIRGTAVKPTLDVCSLDIETDAEHGIIYSIACTGKKDRVFIQGHGENNETVTICQNEKEVLQCFLTHIRTEDPDVIIGWSVVDFDLRIIFERCTIHGIPFIMGRGTARSDRIAPAPSGTHSVARISGRVIIDVPVLLRTYYRTFEEYSLNHVASVLLNKTKEIEASGDDKIAEINRRFASDTMALARYNLQDAVLTREIFDVTESLPNAIERSSHSGHLLDRTGGSIAAFDYLYLPRLHRAGFVAPDASDADVTDTPLPGGYVIEPKPGIYENVLVLDFRSLYPSIIMSFSIDPLGLRLRTNERIQGPCGPSFAREPALLPGIIHELLAARAEAKKKNNTSLSQAIKILMNSFYGVLGARNCRFFSTELSTTITQTGQHILKKSIDYIQTAMALPVIYGDTDSLFVNLGGGHADDADATGAKIASEVTSWLARYLEETFHAESALLLQYETHFRQFLIPSVRGAAHGSKKHYCGGKYENGQLTLHFKGMESVRSDWTDCAKEFQQELIRRIFTHEPLDTYILSVVADVRNGRLDDKLIYRKHLRKRIDEYTQSVPPHVQAAKLLSHPPHHIRYCITVDGPQPLERLTSPLDYRHYIDCQLQPIADSVLELVGSSFEQLTSGQQDLFG